MVVAHLLPVQKTLDKSVMVVYLGGEKRRTWTSGSASIVSPKIFSVNEEWKIKLETERH